MLKKAAKNWLASWIGNAQLSRHPARTYVLLYTCDRVPVRDTSPTSTATFRRMFYLTQKTAEWKRGVLSRVRICVRVFRARVYVCVYVYVCNSTCRTRAIRGAGRVASMPRDGRSGPVVLIASKPPRLPRRHPDAFHPVRTAARRTVREINARRE